MPKATKTTKKTKKVTSKSTKPVEVKIEKPVMVSDAVQTPSKYTNLLMAALIIAALAGYAYYRFWNIATVNGSPISRLEYYQTMEQQIGKQTLENLITETLIIDAAEKNNVVVDQSVIDQDIAAIESQIMSQGQTLEEALTAEGMTRADLEKQMRIQKYVETLSASDSAITDAQINEFLTTNKAQLPADKSAEELKELAKTQLESQAKSENIRKWLSDIRATANITYK